MNEFDRRTRPNEPRHARERDRPHHRPPNQTAARMPWTREQIRAARRAPLLPILRELGYQFRPEPGGNFRLIPGLAPIEGIGEGLVIKENYWCWPDHGPTGDAGNTIDFLARVHGLSFHQAMEFITAHTGG